LILSLVLSINIFDDKFSVLIFVCSQNQLRRYGYNASKIKKIKKKKENETLTTRKHDPGSIPRKMIFMAKPN